MVSIVHGRRHWSMTKLKQWLKAYCVFAYHLHDEHKLYINEKISKTSLAAFQASFCFMNEARVLGGEQ